MSLHINLVSGFRIPLCLHSVKPLQVVLNSSDLWLVVDQRKTWENVLFHSVRCSLYFDEHRAIHSYFAVCNYTMIFSFIIANSDFIATKANKQGACVVCL